MKKYAVRFTKVARKDFSKLSPTQVERLKDIVRHTLSVRPYTGKRLRGDIGGLYSIRLSYKDRIVYSIDEEHSIVYILRAKTYYGD